MNGTQASNGAGDVRAVATKGMRAPFFQKNRRAVGSQLTEHMKEFFRKIWAGRSALPEDEPGMEVIAPLAQFVDDVDPDVGMLERIEASLDAVDHARIVKRNRSYQRRVPPLVAFGLGVVLTGVCTWALYTWTTPDRQAIFAKPSGDTVFLPMGAVTLHGPALRGFVRAKCEGQTHFFIAMYAADTDPASKETAQGTSLMYDGEKILMECIF